MPGTSPGIADDVHRQALLGAGLGDVEARTGRPATTRTASGDLLLGFGGIVGTSSRQRTQPARARCSTRWSRRGVDVEELAVPGDVVDQRALERATAAGRRSSAR